MSGPEGLDTLVADLATAGQRLDAAVKPVVSKGALNIKNAWRIGASGLSHAPAYPYSITYDLNAAPGTGLISAEIGPDKNKKQGALGNLLEFGSANNPPHLDGARALAAEEPRFLAALEAAAEAAMLP